MKLILEKLTRREDLSSEEAEALMKGMLNAEITSIQAAGILAAMKTKGETIEEITAFARAARERSLKANVPFQVTDTCGTGGDLLGTFNISTLSAIAASCHTPIAKHGNRSASGRCGSADLLEALGVQIQRTPAQAEEDLKQNNFAFLFAPIFNPAMKNVAQARKELGIRTIFNIIGPLINPASASSQILGVHSPQLTEPIANVLNKLGIERAMVVHSMGADEMTLLGDTQVSELRNGQVETYAIKPEDFGYSRCKLPDIQAANMEQNKEMAYSVLKGERGSRLDTVALNTAAAIHVSGKRGLEESNELAKNILHSGQAFRKLEEIRGKNDA